jgi:hypothetical protein
MKFKTLIIFLIFNVNSLSAQFFDCEEDFEIIENEEIIDAAANILSEKASIFLIDSIVDYGKIFLGTPYRYGGSTPSAFDCSGFVSYVYNNFGIKLPRTATAQYLANTHIDRENLHKGDLVFFEGRKKNSRIGHVGIVVSDSLENGLFKFMHASVTRGVTVSLSNENYYENRYITACRIVEIDSISIPRKRTDILVKKDIENQYHTVKKGETLYFISKKYGKTVAQLKTLNKISDNNLKIGQKLLINKILKNKS